MRLTAPDGGCRIDLAFVVKGRAVAKKSVRRKPAKKAVKRPPSNARKVVSTTPKEPRWLKVLRRRKRALSIAIEKDGAIAFWKYSFDGPHDYNLMVWHPEGDLDFGFDEPPSGEEEMGDPAISEWDNQYRPGHLIHDSLTPTERKSLGMRQRDAGGPASGGCMTTTVTCTLDELNVILRTKKLPFFVVEDKRFARPSHPVPAKK